MDPSVPRQRNQSRVARWHTSNSHRAHLERWQTSFEEAFETLHLLRAPAAKGGLTKTGAKDALQISQVMDAFRGPRALYGGCPLL